MKSETQIVVSRVFADNKVTLLNLYANYVAKRIMDETETTNEDTAGEHKICSSDIDISDLVW